MTGHETHVAPAVAPDASTAPAVEGTGQTVGAAQLPVVASTTEPTAPTGKRQELRNLSRDLADGDLASPGVQKFLLGELERKDAECEQLKAYVDKYHETDKRLSISNEQLKTQTSIEVMFTAGLAIGSAIIGLSPVFWDDTSRGPLVLVFGILLVLGAIAGKVIKR